MNTKNSAYESKYTIKNKAVIKTISLQVAITEPDLKNAVRTAFDLAKSSGLELDLAFTLQPLTELFPKQSLVKMTYPAQPRLGC